MSSVSASSHVAWISLGGNLGDADATIERALTLLDHTAGIDVLQISTSHRTAAVGELAGAPYVNAVAQLATSLEPIELLDRLQAIEMQLGRVRTVRWGPRTLDLDLLMYDSAVIDLPRLRVPHPACWYRRFVLDPWVEIGADVVHPVKQLTVRRLRERLLERPMRISLTGGESSRREHLLALLKREFPQIAWAGDIDLDEEPTLSLGLGAEGFTDKQYAALPTTFFASWLELEAREPADVEAIREIVHSATGE